MTAEVEETVVGADLLDLQHLREQVTQSSFPAADNGSASSSSIAAGTMYPGSALAAAWRSAAASRLWPGAGTT
jgi:hypothetical protein